MDSLSAFLVLITIIVRLDAVCDSVYTVGEDELCTVSLTTFDEQCITFNSTYGIVATNGLSIDPLTGVLYLVASIGANNGDRKLFSFTDESEPSFTTIATYTSSNHKLAGIAHSCEGEMFGITGAQADHSFYSIDETDGTLTKMSDLDASTKGNGIAYDPEDDHVYRISGTTQVDVEAIDIDTGNVTSDLLLDIGINKVRAIGYYMEDYLFVIDDNEYLYKLNTETGALSHLHNLTDTRHHKGIICTDIEYICSMYKLSTFFPESTQFIVDGSTEIGCPEDTRVCDDGTVLYRSDPPECKFGSCIDTDIAYKLYSNSIFYLVFSVIFLFYSL